MKDEVTSREERIDNLKGMGCSRKRVEDARFTQGKGNYVDDVKLDGMLFGDFVRSPYAHARIKSIDTAAALEVPGVLAVLTAKDLEPLGLHWMPTLAGDKQMVLADGKVLFQGQVVAFVVAEDRYSAADGIEAVEVEYEELEVLVDPFRKEGEFLRADPDDVEAGFGQAIEVIEQVSVRQHHGVAAGQKGFTNARARGFAACDLGVVIFDIGPDLVDRACILLGLAGQEIGTIAVTTPG